MKKAIFLALTLFVSVAQADGYSSVRGEYRPGRNGTQDSEAASITVGKNINQYIDGELHARIKSNDDTNNTRVEGAVIGKLPLTDEVSFYTRGAVGEKFDGSNNDAYWSVEPDIRALVTSALTAKAGLRFRDAFDNSSDSTRTYRVGADYALDKTSVVTLGYDRSYGDSEFDAVNVGYGVKY